MGLACIIIVELDILRVMKNTSKMIARTVNKRRGKTREIYILFINALLILNHQGYYAYQMISILH